MSGELSLYIHVPFCEKKCGYCHFYVIPDQASHKALYLKSLKKEWERLPPALKTRPYSSIYFGGGTPSLLSPQEIEEILSWIPKRAGCETTLEANPEQGRFETLQGFYRAGINRLSFGVQSFEDRLLAVLERKHDGKRAEEAVLEARKAGFENISIDLMYDLPGQTLADWKKTLERAVSLPLSHLSLYNLTLEPQTAFYKKRERLKPLLPSEEASLEMLEVACSELPKAGLERYEISAFAKASFASKHNSAYWLGTPFIGLGPSAFSYLDGRRSRNIAHLQRYAALLEEGQKTVDFEERLQEKERIRELFILRLRFVGGFSLSAFEREVGALDEECLETVEELKERGLIEEEGERLKLSPLGRNHYEFIASELV